jgi:hypothetical protein
LYFTALIFFLSLDSFAKGSWVKLISNQKLGKPDYNETKQALQAQLQISHGLLNEIILEFLATSNYALEKNRDLEVCML